MVSFPGNCVQFCVPLQGFTPTKDVHPEPVEGPALSLPKGPFLFSTAQLPVQKTRAANPCVSITSRLIENQRTSTPAFRSLTKNRGEGELPAGTHHASSGRIAPSCSSATFPKAHLSPPAASANLCVLSASALDFLFPRSWLPALSMPNGSTVDCQLSAISSPLTPVFPPLARRTPNMPIFYLLPTTGGPPWSDHG